ncbi:uncharacterized protein [Rutidosis leptorrhynchoides]|uniref:uncharacterized protein n=1 Tax=Rutidosis leptorrhynchoides TaxID=125765 RepID=UPI003A994500
MGVFVDHYLILGLQSGEEGCKVSIEEIKKAYKKKAILLHPDKRANDPNAVAEFQELQAKSAQCGVIDKEKMVRVWWAKVGCDYSVENLRDVFDKFGEVENVIMSCKNERSALVVMATKEAVIAACRFVCGDGSNPLLVFPLQGY